MPKGRYFIDPRYPAHSRAVKAEGPEGPMHVERADLADLKTDNLPHADPHDDIPTPRQVLEELFQLLEDYAPAWYTEAHHNRAVSALLGRRV
jgi:hypothetical protein